MILSYVSKQLKTLFSGKWYSLIFDHTYCILIYVNTVWYNFDSIYRNTRWHKYFISNKSRWRNQLITRFIMFGKSYGEYIASKPFITPNTKSILGSISQQKWKILHSS